MEIGVRDGWNPGVCVSWIGLFYVERRADCFEEVEFESEQRNDERGEEEEQQQQ